MMKLIEVETFADAVRKGTLVDLSNDYRTSRTIYSYLPRPTRCAMSAAAFRQNLVQGTAGERQLRIESICTVLTSILAAREADERPSVEFSFRGTDGQPQGERLKLQWFAPDQYWVVLLPDEQLVGAAVAPAARWPIAREMSVGAI
jgi:hypothetical protein